MSDQRERGRREGRPAGKEATPAAGSARREVEEPAAEEGESLLPSGNAAPSPEHAPERPKGTTAA